MRLLGLLCVVVRDLWLLEKASVGWLSVVHALWLLEKASVGWLSSTIGGEGVGQLLLCFCCVLVALSLCGFSFARCVLHGCWRRL